MQHNPARAVKHLMRDGQLVIIELIFDTYESVAVLGAILDLEIRVDITVTHPRLTLEGKLGVCILSSASCSMWPKATVRLGEAANVPCASWGLTTSLELLRRDGATTTRLGGQKARHPDWKASGNGRYSFRTFSQAHTRRRSTHQGERCPTTNSSAWLRGEGRYYVDENTATSVYGSVVTAAIMSPKAVSTLLCFN